MREGAQIDTAGEIELGRRLLSSEALRAGGMAVLWLSLAVLLAGLYFGSHSRGSVMPGHMSLIAITLFAALHQGFCLLITRRRLVNLAFRMEQANKEIGSRLVVSAEAAQAAGIRDPVSFSELPVRGRSLPVRLCRLA